MKLILVRHGETDGNKAGYTVGAIDIPLNENGKNQVDKLARRLQNESIAVIYTSNLTRAKETAQAIAHYHPHVPFVVDERIRERNYGALEGKGYAEVLAAAKAHGVHNYHFRPERGESGVDMLARIAPLLDSIFETYKGKTVVMVSHGQMMRVLLMHYLNLPPEKYEELSHQNTGITVIDVSDSGPHKAQILQDASHLEE